MIGGLGTLGRWFIDRGMRKRHARRTPRPRHHGLWRHGRLEATALLFSSARRRCLPGRPRQGGSRAVAPSRRVRPVAGRRAEGAPHVARRQTRRGRSTDLGWRRAVMPESAEHASRRCTRHRRDRLHRGTAGARPRSRGRSASLSRPSPGRARVARVADDGSGRRGSPRSGVARSRPRGNRRGLLPRALHGRTRRLPRKGSRGRPQFWRSGAAGGGSANRVPRRPRNGRRGAQQASQEPDRDGRGAASKRGTGRGVPRVCRHRVGQPLVRAHPRARRASAGHDLPAVGFDPGAADRHR